MNKGTHFSGQQYYVLMNVCGEQKKTGRGVSLDSSSPRRELFSRPLKTPIQRDIVKKQHLVEFFF